MPAIYKFQGIILELDYNNADTPAMVWSADRHASASYECATATGEQVHDQRAVQRQQELRRDHRRAPFAPLTGGNSHTRPRLSAG